MSAASAVRLHATKEMMGKFIKAVKAATDDRCAVYFGGSDFIGATNTASEVAQARLYGSSWEIS